MYARHPNHETVPCYHNITSFNWITFIASVWGRWMVEPTGVCGRKIYSHFSAFSTVLSNFIVEAREKNYLYIPHTHVPLYRAEPRPGFIGCTFFYLPKLLYLIRQNFVSKNVRQSKFSSPLIPSIMPAKVLSDLFDL